MARSDSDANEEAKHGVSWWLELFQIVMCVRLVVSDAKVVWVPKTPSSLLSRFFYFLESLRTFRILHENIILPKSNSIISFCGSFFFFFFFYFYYSFWKNATCSYSIFFFFFFFTREKNVEWWCIITVQSIMRQCSSDFVFFFSFFLWSRAQQSGRERPAF